MKMMMMRMTGAVVSVDRHGENDVSAHWLVILSDTCRPGHFVQIQTKDKVVTLV